MKTTTRSKIQMLGAWCGVGYVVVVVLGWIAVAGFFPLHQPAASAEEITAIFVSDHTRIRAGMIIVMFAALVMIPFAALISQFVAKIEGGAGILAYSALLGGAGTMVLTFYPAIWWLVAAFRPERAAELIYLMNDMAWLQFIGGVSMYDALPIAIAIAAFCDTSPNPVFPRWVGWYNLFVIVMILPDMLLFFFHEGPFAWNGIFGFWVPLAGFGSWWIVMFFVLRKAILRERQVAA
jgi:hypothetical protein